MIKKYFWHFICVLISLFLLQVSCSTGRYVEGLDQEVLPNVEQSGEGVSGKVEDTAEKRLYLAGTHIDSGIECAGCHIEGSDDNDVSTSVCISCHGGFAEIASQGTSRIDPHNSHMMFSECSDCHHAHFPSQDQCQSCHNFGFQIP
jgi:hypothetical protein